MDSRLGGFYSRWHAGNGSQDRLHDENSLPPESLLQAVWHHQRLLRDSLKTIDGRSVRVLHPGFLSTTGGPDFQKAILQFDQDVPISGDIEVDLHPHNWRAHGHDANANFGNVRLHVVWAASEHSREPMPKRADRLAAPPILELRPILDAPLPELSRWMESVPAKSLPDELRGRCCAPLRELTPEQLLKVLRGAAGERFQRKATALRARAQHVGWEQALWEFLFRALGYKQNIWPMQNLAESRAAWQSGPTGVSAIQARLLGLSGLLPVELTRSRISPDQYVRHTWDAWWRERDGFGALTLPRAVWQFHGLRPANQPQRRLALAAHWLASPKFINKIEAWCIATIPAERLVDSLLEILDVPDDAYWSWHWTLHSARLTRPQPLLGEARVTDVAINVILPWLWVRAVVGSNHAIQAEMERRYFAWPCGADNSVLKLARQRLLGTTSARALPDAASQQGLLQITRDFCDHSDALCNGCRFPEMIRSSEIER